MAMIAALVSLMTLGLVLGGLLGIAARFFAVEGNPLEAEVEAMFPGSQCGQCGFPGCTPAAAAVVAGDAPVTLCPPGGRSLAEALAEKVIRNELLEKDALHIGRQIMRENALELFPQLRKRLWRK